jgi:MFS family permease
MPEGFTASERRDIRLIAAFRGISLTGDILAMWALMLRLVHHGNSLPMAALLLAGAIPPVVLTPIAGLVVDRIPAKRFLAAVCLVDAAIAVGLGYWTGTVPTIILVALLGCGTAFTQPGYAALVPAIASPHNMARAQSLLQSVAGSAQITGPVLGAVLVAATGRHWPLYIDAISFALCAIGTLALHGDRVPATRAHREERAMSAGIRFLAHDKLLAPLLIQVFFFVSALGAVGVAEPFFVRLTLHGSAVVYGCLGAVYGLGNVVGALSARMAGMSLVRLVTFETIGVAVIGAGFVVVSFITQPWFILAPFFAAGMGNGIANTGFSTIMPVRIPADVQGRAFAAVGSIVTGANIGSMAVGGLLLHLWTARTVILVGGLVSLVALVIFSPATFVAARHEDATQGA